MYHLLYTYKLQFLLYLENSYLKTAVYLYIVYRSNRIET